MPADTPRGVYADDPRIDGNPGRFESAISGVSWGAIIAGGVAAAAVAVILMFLGAGLGLMAVSPWGDKEGAEKTLGIGVIVWSFLLQIIAFGVGGYLAGRLRTRWVSLHRDESYFRDTAHGFLTWAFGSLVTLCVMTSTVGHLAQGVGSVAAHGVGAAAGAGAMVGMEKGMSPGSEGMGGLSPHMSLDYFIDTMMRPGAGASTPGTSAQGASGQGTAGQSTSDQGTTGQTTTGQSTTTAQTPTMPMNGQSAGSTSLDPQARGEIMRVVTTSLVNGSPSQPDKDYLAQLVASRTGLSQQDAAKRVDDTFAQIQASVQKAADKAKEFADNARQAAIGFTLWSFAAMLVGAFSAAIAGTMGGKARDIY
jgi:hypothetical protein